MRRRNYFLNKVNALALVILTVFSLISCKKEKQNDIDKKVMLYKVDQGLLSKYFFGAGSYWIYQNQNLNEDSVIVKSVENGVTPDPQYGAKGTNYAEYEFYKMNFKNMSQGNDYNYYFMNNYIKLNGGGEYGVLNGQPIFMYEAHINEEFNGATVFEKIDSLNILGNMYYDITKMKISAVDQWVQVFTYDTDMYFADHIGLIKKEIFDTINGTQSYELKKYDIK